MTDAHSKILDQEIWGQKGPSEVLLQVSELVKRTYEFGVEISADGKSFRSIKYKEERSGVQSVVARLEDDAIIRVRIELLDSTARVGPALDHFWKHVSNLSERVRPLPPVSDASSGKTSYWLELKVQASSHLGIVRETALANELESIDSFAAWIHSELPRQQSMVELEKLYAEHSQVLSPLWPLDVEDLQTLTSLVAWSEETVELLQGSLNVAVAAESQVHQEIALAALTRATLQRGGSVGLVHLPAVSAKNIIEVAKQAPGRVVVPASRISLGISPYEIGDQIQSLLAILSSARTPAIFNGRYQQLQAVFHGGQGGSCDPLVPVVTHVPEVPMDTLVKYSLQAASRQCGGVSESELATMHRAVAEALSSLPETEQLRLLPAVAAREMANRHKKTTGSDQSARSFVAQVAGISETLAGLERRSRAHRLAAVQDNLVDRILGPDLLGYFTRELFAQDEALGQLVDRLQMECLTRPDHQPIRYCVQGTPGTGKSQSAVMLAQFLNIPHVNIDAASQPDYHTASAQLLGSGRGIVGSYEAGRLEKAAKNAQGAVVEVSDLDHAPSSVRGHLADLFLQILDTGEAQSATGATFSCANLIFAFTINLPAGQDERINRGIGFSGLRSRKDVQSHVETEIKLLFSNAFLSRIGRPILFSPLSGSELGMIAEREIERALCRGITVLKTSCNGVKLEQGLGARIVSSLEAGLMSHGARIVAEQARLLATNALLRLRESQADLAGNTLVVRSSADSILYIEIQK